MAQPLRHQPSISLAMASNVYYPVYTTPSRHPQRRKLIILKTYKGLVLCSLSARLDSLTIRQPRDRTAFQLSLSKHMVLRIGSYPPLFFGFFKSCPLLLLII